MSAPVDVLAVLEATSAGLHSVASSCSPGSNLSRPMRERAEEVDEARAAVAELIEAADGVDATHGPMLNPRAVTPKQRQAALNRLRAALARVSGGEA